MLKLTSFSLKISNLKQFKKDFEKPIQTTDVPPPDGTSVDWIIFNNYLGLGQIYKNGKNLNFWHFFNDSNQLPSKFFFFGRFEHFFKIFEFSKANKLYTF